MRVAFFLLLIGAPLWAGERSLSLREAVQRAIDHSPDLAMERIAVRHAEAVAFAARGAFDPVLRLDGNFRRAVTPVSSALESPFGRVEERAISQSVAFRHLLPWNGLRFEAHFDNARTSTTNPFFALSPYVVPRAAATLTMPLLRGRRTDPERSELLIRQRRVGVAVTEAETKQLDVIARVEAAYWELVASRLSAASAEGALALAHAANDATVRLVSQGELPVAERSSADAMTAARAEALALAQGRVGEAEASLKELIAASLDDDIWLDTIVPTDTHADAAVPDASEAIRAALEHRPELRTLARQQQVLEAEQAGAMDALKPRIDLSAQYTAQGLAGRAVPQSDLLSSLGLVGSGVPRNFLGGFGRSLSQLGGGRFPTFQAGLTIELPFRNRTAQGQLTQSALSLERLRQQRRRLELAIAAQVRKALSALTAGHQRLTAAKEGITAAQARLASELRLFSLGESTTLNVNTRQSEATSAKEAAIRAQQQINQAAADLRRFSPAYPLQL